MAASCAARAWKHVDRVDQRISDWVFQHRMPFTLELLLSVPGVWFGMPIAALAVFPLLLSSFECSFVHGHESCEPLTFLATGFTACVLVAWLLACVESSRRKHTEHDSRQWYGISRLYFPIGKSTIQMLFGALLLPFYGTLFAFTRFWDTSNGPTILFAYYISWYSAQGIVQVRTNVNVVLRDDVFLRVQLSTVQVIKTWASRGRPAHRAPQLIEHHRHLHQVDMGAVSGPLVRQHSFKRSLLVARRSNSSSCARQQHWNHSRVEMHVVQASFYIISFASSKTLSICQIQLRVKCGGLLLD